MLYTSGPSRSNHILKLPAQFPDLFNRPIHLHYLSVFIFNSGKDLLYRGHIFLRYGRYIFKLALRIFITSRNVVEYLHFHYNIIIGLRIRLFKGYKIVQYVIDQVFLLICRQIPFVDVILKVYPCKSHISPATLF